MKKLAISLLMIAGFTTASFAEGGRTLPDSIPSTIVPLPRVPPELRRPYAPVRDYINCEYGRGYLRLTLPAGVYYATIQLFNDSFEWTGLATTEQPLVELPEDFAGQYTIICRTDDGRVFSGILEF